MRSYAYFVLSFLPLSLPVNREVGLYFFETTTCKNQYGLIYNSRFPREGCIYNTMLITKNHLIMLSGFLFLGSLFLLNKKKD